MNEVGVVMRLLLDSSLLLIWKCVSRNMMEVNEDGVGVSDLMPLLLTSAAQ